MKYAYISTQEPFSLGVRIVQVNASKDGLLDVDNLLFWVQCADSVTAEDYYYDVTSNEIKPVPVVVK